MGLSDGLVGRYRNVLLVVAAAGAGVLTPNLGPVLEPLVTPLVVFLVYSFLRGIRLREMASASDAFLASLSAGLSYVLLPVGGIRVANVFLPESAALGFAIVFAAPTTAVSAVWTRFAGADVRLATTSSAVSILVAPVVTPVVLDRLVGSQAAVPVVSVLTTTLTIVVGGVLLTALVPSSAISDRTVDTGAMLALLLLIYASTAGVDPAGVDGYDLLAIAGVSALLLSLGLVVATWFERALRLDRTRTLPLFFTSSMKNLGIALLIALTYSGPLVTVSIITYFVVQQLVCALIADFAS